MREGTIPVQGKQLVNIKLCQVRFRVDIRENFFTKMVVKYRNRLCRAEVESPSLEGFKRHGDAVLRDMVLWWPGSADLTVGLNELKGFFQPQ